MKLKKTFRWIKSTGGVGGGGSNVPRLFHSGILMPSFTHVQLFETMQGVNTTSQIFSRTYPHFNLGVPNCPFVCEYHSVQSKVPVLSTVLCVSEECTVCPNTVHFVSQHKQNPQPKLVLLPFSPFPSHFLHQIQT